SPPSTRPQASEGTRPMAACSPNTPSRIGRAFSTSIMQSPRTMTEEVTRVGPTDESHAGAAGRTRSGRRRWALPLAATEGQEVAGPRDGVVVLGDLPVVLAPLVAVLGHLVAVLTHLRVHLSPLPIGLGDRGLRADKPGLGDPGEPLDLPV